MKQINLLPEPNFLDRYKRFLMTITRSLCISIGSCVLFLYIKAFQPPASSTSPFFKKDTPACFRYSINQLKMVGFLSQDTSTTVKRCWSLLSLLDGQIIILQKNDCVGFERAKVVSIQSTGVGLKAPDRPQITWIKMAISHE